MPADRALPQLTQPEFASLVVLMATARELTNPELKELAGFDLTGKERRTLNDLKLVESRKRGRVFAHELTEDGWLVCRDLLATKRPVRAGSLGGALFAVLAGLGAGLDRRGLSPAHFFDPYRSEDGRRVAGDEDGSPPAETVTPEKKSAAADPAVVGSAIREAYAALVTARSEWVSLASLRTELDMFTRAEVDQALRILVRERGVHITPVANLKSLTPADRDAALRLGGQENHVLAIEVR